MKYLPMAFIVILAYALTLAGCADSNAVEPASDRYLQLSSAVDQGGGTFKAEIIDAQNGIDYDAVTGQVTIDKAGAYLLVYAPQVGTTADCSTFWVNVNGTQLDNSNIKICNTDIGQTSVGVSQAIVVLEKGDVVTFEMGGALGTQATQPDGEPLIPSAIISVFKL